jgi:hypothetical protein
MRVPIASRSAGGHAGNQNDQTVQTPHGASPRILVDRPPTRSARGCARLAP